MGVVRTIREHLKPMWAEEAGCLIVLNAIDGKSCFDYPIPDDGVPADNLMAFKVIALTRLLLPDSNASTI